LPSGCAVDMGCFVKLGRNTLYSRQKNDDGEAKRAPQCKNNEKHHRRFGIPQRPEGKTEIFEYVGREAKIIDKHPAEEQRPHYCRKNPRKNDNDLDEKGKPPLEAIYPESNGQTAHKCRADSAHGKN